MLVALVGQAAGLIALALILAVRGVDADSFLPGALSGVVGSVAILAFYRALALGTMSVVAPIVATSAIVPVFAGVLLDGERPGALQWMGIVARARGRRARQPRAGPHAPRSTRARRSSSRSSRRSSSASRSSSSTTRPSTTRSAASPPRASSASPILGVLAWRAAARAPLRALPKLGAIGLLDTGANTAFAIATTGGLLSLVAVLGGLFPVVTVALAYFFLHERLMPIQRAGVLLALAGIPLISA